MPHFPTRYPGFPSRRLEEERDLKPDLPIPPNDPGPSPRCNPPGPPMPESRPGDQRGPGEAALKKFNDLTAPWGKLNEIERAKVITELIRDLPPASDRWSRTTSASWRRPRADRRNWSTVL